MTSPYQPRGPAAEAPRSRTRRLRWWISGITFVAGFVFGIVAVGLLNVTTPDFGTATGGERPSEPSPRGSIPVVAEARVNAACLAVINDAQDVFTVLTDLDQAMTDVDLQALDDIVRRLQPVEARLGRDLPNCQVDATTSQPTEVGTPRPSPTPTR